MREQSQDVAIVRVWDLPVRLVHWAMVVLLVVLIVTVQMGGEAMMWHMRAGEAMLALVIFRLLWGFVGSRHARFASFVRGPGSVIGYARSIIRPPHQWHAGHNPLGGWMVIVLLLVLLLQGSSGLLANDDIAYDGPLAHLVSKDLSDTISGFHHNNGWLIVVLAGVHIAAVLLYLVAFRDNLVAPMIHGVKRAPVAHQHAAMENAHAGRALVLFALCAFSVWCLVTRV